jgi:DNA-binding transcriptional LysR family regulator
MYSSKKWGWAYHHLFESLKKSVSPKHFQRKKMLRLDDLTVFVRTADRGSLSAAARELEISPALASAAVKRLEGVGLRLFARTTRSLRLTEEGKLSAPCARSAAPAAGRA